MPQTFLKVSGNGFFTPFAVPRTISALPVEKPRCGATAPSSTRPDKELPEHPAQHLGDDFKRKLLKAALSDRRAEVLHTYNEVKDIAQTALGVIAARRSCSLVQLYDALGIEHAD